MCLLMFDQELRYCWEVDHLRCLRSYDISTEKARKIIRVALSVTEQSVLK